MTPRGILLHEGDERLRELERRAQAGGDPRAIEAYIRAFARQSTNLRAVTQEMRRFGIVGSKLEEPLVTYVREHGLPLRDAIKELRWARGRPSRDLWMAWRNETLNKLQTYLDGVARHAGARIASPLQMFGRAWNEEDVFEGDLVIAYPKGDQVVHVSLPLDVSKVGVLGRRFGPMIASEETDPALFHLGKSAADRVTKAFKSLPLPADVGAPSRKPRVEKYYPGQEQPVVV